MKYSYFFLCVPVILCAEFRLGIENIPDSLVAEYSQKRLKIGLVTNQTGIDQRGVRTIDTLLNKGFNVCCLFAPEHGINGLLPAGQEVKEGVSSLSIPIISLYAGGDKSKKVDPQVIKDLDALFVDIQDSGMRHYTYISTLYEILRAAGTESKRVIVFDRPNPLGKRMEGPLVDTSLISFISIAPIPLRHGMTMGELAEYFNRYMIEKKADLHVVWMNDYARTTGIPQFNAPLSPNIASHASCLGYSFLGLLGEVKPFDVGVGTPDAFQVITLPQSLNVSSAVWESLAVELQKLGITTIPYHYFNERKKEHYKGVRLHFANINSVKAFHAFLKTVTHMKKQGIALDFATNFDKSVGSKKVRLFILGLVKYQELLQEIEHGLLTFMQKARAVFKYVPYPEIV